MIERELAAVPREARPYQGEPAGVVTRLVANTIDFLVVVVALGALYLGVAAVVFMLDPREFTFPAAGLLLSITAALSLSTAYLALAWWLVGKTYGDHIMGLRVVGRRRRRLGPLRSLARAAFCVFFPIGLFWCVVSPHRRSVQDVVLWTRVVYDWLPADHDHEHGHGHHQGQEHEHAGHQAHGEDRGSENGSPHGHGRGHDREHRREAGPPAGGDAPRTGGATESTDAPPTDRSTAEGRRR